MKALIILIALTSHFAYGYVGELMFVSSVKYHDFGDKTPSCNLLVQREKAFKRKVREQVDAISKLDFLEYVKTDKHIKKYIKFNEFESYENLVKVHIIAEPKDELINEIKDRGIENVYFSIQSAGVLSSRLAKFHKDLFGINIIYNNETNKILIEYLMPKVIQCLSDKSVYFSWVKNSVKEKDQLILLARSRPSFKNMLLNQKSILDKSNMEYVAELKENIKLVNQLKNGEFELLDLENLDLSDSMEAYYLKLSNDYVDAYMKLAISIERFKRNNFYFTVEDNNTVKIDYLHNYFVGTTRVPQVKKVYERLEMAMNKKIEIFFKFISREL